MNYPQDGLLDNITAVILAGGQGTRLFPLTINRCKPAVGFGGRYRLIDVPISNSLNSGIRNIAVISQYFAAHLNQHILATYRLDTFQPGEFQLLCPEETPTRKVWFEGTADAIRQNLERLLATPAEYFLILSGDQLYNFDFRQMIDFAKQKDADLVVAALPVYEAEARRMGLLKIDDHQNITDFFEKPSDPEVLTLYRLPAKLANKASTAPQYLGSMGIYVFKRSALASILKEEGVDFGRHIIPLQVARGKCCSFVFDGYWEDIGTVASYYQANLALTSRKECLDIYNERHPIYTQAYHLPSALVLGTKVHQSILAQGCLIEAEEISHSIVGIRAKIGRGSIIRDSIVLGKRDLTHWSKAAPALSIGSNCHIEKAIIDEDTHIGNHVRLINEKKQQHYDGDGVFIRDGIIIVTNGTSLPDGFTL